MRTGARPRGPLACQTRQCARRAPALSSQYGYDAAGQLTLARNLHSRIALAYDLAGQLIEESLAASWSVLGDQAGDSAERQQTLRHQYDELGNRIGTPLPDGRQINQLYYGSGHLHQINLDFEVISDFRRDALHREIARTQGGLWQRTRYDAMGRITEQGSAVHASGMARLARQATPAAPGAAGSTAPLTGADAGRTHTLGHGAHIQRNYRYDAGGQLLQVSDARRPSLSTRYQYDSLGQLLGAIGAGGPGHTERFAFDPAHNLLPASTANPGGSSAGFVQNNRLKVFEDKRYQHDAHGRVHRKRIGSHTEIDLHWDAEHQLTKAVTTRNGVPQTTDYAYDPFGRRLYKRDKFAATWFLWDGNRLLQEHTKALNRLYFYEPDSFVPLAYS